MSTAPTPAATTTIAIEKPSPIGAFWYWGVVGLWLTILCMAFGYFASPFNAHIHKWTGFGWLPWFVALATAYMGFGFRKQTSDEWGIKLLFGSRPFQQTGHGPIHILWPLFTIDRYSKAPVQEEYPAENDRIDWERNADQPPAPDKVAPIRVTTSEDAQDEGVLGRIMTLNVSISTAYQVTDPVQFLLVLGSGEKGRGNARKQVQDMSEAVLTSVVATHSAAWTLKNKRVIEQMLKDALQLLVEGTQLEIDPVNTTVTGSVTDSSCAWGVNVTMVTVNRIDLPQKVNEAMRLVAAAVANKKTTVINSEAKATETTNQATADGKATRKRLAGFGLGLKTAANSSGLTPAQVASAQVAGDMARNTNATNINLGPGGIADLVSQVAKALVR